jgi:threonine dehydratase
VLFRSAAVRFRAHELDLAALDGVVVAVVSGGNVDPAQYRELLTSPVPN